MARAALANIHFFLEWNWAAAEVEYQRAIALDPNYVWGRQHYAMALASQGRFDEALEQVQKVRERDPLVLASTGGVDLGMLRMWNGDAVGAVEAWKGALDLQPTHYASLLNLGGYYCGSGRADEGLALLERARELYPETPRVLAELAAGHAESGNEVESRRLLGELEEWFLRDYVDPVNLAIVHLALGEDDRVFAWLERAYDRRASMMTDIGSDPRFERLYPDPRFRDLLERVGLRERSPRG